MKIFDWYKTEDGFYMYLECVHLTRWRTNVWFNTASPKVMLPKIKRR